MPRFWAWMMEDSQAGWVGKAKVHLDEWLKSQCRKASHMFVVASIPSGRHDELCEGRSRHYSLANCNQHLWICLSLCCDEVLMRVVQYFFELSELQILQGQAQQWKRRAKPSNNDGEKRMKSGADVTQVTASVLTCFQETCSKFFFDSLNVTVELLLKLQRLDLCCLWHWSGPWSFKSCWTVQVDVQLYNCRKMFDSHRKTHC